MNFIRFLFIAISFCVFSLNAQEFKLCFQTGYGFYNMSSMSAITQKTLEQLPFEAKIISNYPPYIYYQPMIKFSSDDFDFGFVYLFQTTGSRISSKDYSGEYRFDTKINCISPGIMVNATIEDFGIFKVGLGLQSGMNFSTFKMDEYLQVDTIVKNIDYKLTANSFYFEPITNFTHQWNRISVDFNIGYFIEFYRKDYIISDESQKEIEVKKENNLDVWDGFRIGVTFSYAIFKKDNRRRR